MAAPIRVAILGFGTAGRVFHGPFLAADADYEVAAIVTRDAARREQATLAHPGAALVESPQQVWAEASSYDLAIIATPSGTHEQLAMQALDAGLDVVVDKPFAVTSAGGRALIEHAQATGRALTVFQNRRWDGDFLTVRKLVEAGELGTVHRFESRFEWWKPTQAASWKTTSRREEGGGILYDLGAHLIDQALQLFGPVVDVYSELDVRRAAVRSEDDAFVALEHESGVRSHLWMSALAPAPAPRFHIQGSLAGYTSWGLDGQESALAAGARPQDARFGTTAPERWGAMRTGAEERVIPMERGDYAAFYRQLASALRGEGELPVDPHDAVVALELIERCFA